MKTTNRILKVLAGIVLIVLPLAAEQPQLSREDYARAEQYLIWNIGKLAFKIQVVPHFIGKSDRFWYKLATRGGKEFVLVDPALNARQQAFDQVRLAASLSAASGKAYEANSLPFDSIEFVKDGRAIQFDIEKDRWTCGLATYVCTKEETPKEKPEGESLSPDGKWAAYVKDHNLYIRPTAGGEDIRLTTDGEAYYDYGSEAEQSTVAVTERLSGKKQPPVLLWSPDSKKILAHRLDQRKVEPLHLLQSSPPQGFRPILHSYRYALVGDPNLPLAELAVLNAYFLYEICEDAALAELGFIVVNIDGLGTPFRSKAFHDRSYRKMEEAGGLEDHIAGIRHLAAGRPYMDISRVGIYGHSGGGFASTHAILAYPDFYKVAVSSAGNHDQRGYLAGWGEQYQGLLQGDNYKAQANAGLAANLKGKLLLVHGDMDDNVHPALTLQVVDALVKANKDFDLLILPNRNHSFGLDPYFTRRLWDYFVRHLAGAEPPHDYEIKPGKMPS